MPTPQVPDTPHALPIQEHSAAAVGRTWTAADHECLCRIVLAIEALAAELVKRAGER